MTKKRTDCTRIQKDVQTAHPNIRVSVRKTADKRYCAIPDNTLLLTNFALHKSPNAKKKNVFSTELFKQFWGERPCFAGYIVQAALCSYSWGKRMSQYLPHSK
jgi:hypothetical protein